MENRKKILGVDRKIVTIVHKIMLFAILHNTIVAPSQVLINDYFNPNHPVLQITNTIGAVDSAINNSTSSVEQKNNYHPIQKANNVTTTIPSIGTTVAKLQFNADITEGVIGKSSINRLDDASDNLFKFNIDALPQNNVKAFLSYDLSGVSSKDAVARSINERYSTGGYLIKKQNGWLNQKEEIDINWLKEGENKIMFSIPKGADYQYQIKNVKLSFENVTNDALPAFVVSNTQLTYEKNNQIYVKGFVRNADSSLKIYAENTPLMVKDGEFEGFIQLNSELKNRKFLTLKATDSKGLIGQELISFDFLIEADKLYPIETISEKSSSLFKANQSNQLSLENASITIGENAISEDIEVNILKLRNIDIAPMGSGMINVTKDGFAYRFLPDGTKFNKPVELTIGYDEKLIPAGYSIKDIKTFYFNTNSKSWVAVEQDSINEKEKTVTAITDHFTDYINGIIQTPESPETAGFTPTMMNDIKAADPSSDMTIISPPEVSQKGDANVSYPIKIPAGRRGLQPQLAVQYNNEGSNGWLGQGWSISIPAISIDTRWGTPLLDQTNESEIYSLNGEQLMYPNLPIEETETDSDGVYWMPNRHYDVAGTSGVYNTTPRARITDAEFTPRKQGSFAKIIRHGNATTNYYWEVVSTDGTRSWYGGKTQVEPNAVIKNANGDVVHWGLYMIEDVHGNNVKYYYTNQSVTGLTGQNENLNNSNLFYINNIRYTGYNGSDGPYKISFIKSNSLRTDVSINGRLGLKRVDINFLNEIQVANLITNEIIRKYKFNYIEGKFSKTLLSSVSELDKNGVEFYKHEFEYYDDLLERKDLFNNPVTIDVPDFSGNFTLGMGNTLNASRLNSNETTEFSWEVNLRFGLQLFYVDNNPNHHLTFGLPFGESYTKNKGIITMSDMDGNGLDDILFRAKDDLYYYPHYIDNDGNNYFSSDKKKLLNINNFNRTKGRTKTMFFESFDFHFLDFHLGKRRFKTNEETNIYLTDGNGDQLPDIVNEGTVYFNNGLSNSNTNEFVTGSEQTPNMLITAQPITLDPGADPEPEPSEDFDTNYDVVRVWVAPLTGKIRIKDVITFQPTTSESKVVYSIESIIPKLGNNVPYRYYLKEFTNTNTTAYLDMNTLSPGIPLGVNQAMSIEVIKGQRLFFRLHKTIDGKNDILKTNPRIEYEATSSGVNYIPSSPLMDQNGNDKKIYNYENDYILSENQEFSVPNTGNVSITWIPFTVANQNDNVQYKIVKETQTSQSLISTDIYIKNCPNGTSTLVSPTNFTSNYGVVSNIPAGTTIAYKFYVTSDSNVKWREIQWKPTVTYSPDANAQNQGASQVVKYPVAKYSIYQESGHYNNFKLESKSFIDSGWTNPLSWVLPNSIHQYKVLPNTYINPNSPIQFLTSDNGTFLFVVKKDGQLIGKRNVTINGNSISLDNNSPITFYNGNATTNSVNVTCEFYVKGEDNLALFKKYTDIVSYYANSNNISLEEKQNGIGNVVFGYDSEWSNPVSDYNYFWRVKINAYYDIDSQMGAMHRGWGQFIYNDAFDSSTTIPQDNYSKLINNFIIDNQTNNLLNTLTNVLGLNLDACSSLPQEDQDDCLFNQLNSAANLPPVGTVIDSSNIGAIISNFQNNFSFNSILFTPCFLSMKAFRYMENGALDEKWFGLFDSQYSKSDEMRDGNIEDSSIGLIFENPDDNDSEILQGNIHTGMYAIDKFQNSVAISKQAGWGSTAYNNSQSSYSDMDSNFIDINGDRYPDVITSSDYQSTTMTGGHNLPSGSNGCNSVNANNSYNEAITYSGSYSTSGRKSVDDSEDDPDTGNPSYSIGLGLSANLSGNNEERKLLVDLNGDGLLDRVEENVGFNYKLNIGKSFNAVNFEAFPLYEPARTKPNALDANFSLSTGFNVGNVPLSVSVGYSSTGGNTETSLQDMNGDGLADLVKFTASSGTVQYNLGNKFSNVVEPITHSSSNQVNLFGSSKNSSASVSVNGTYFYGFSICCWIIPILYLKFGASIGLSANLTISEANKEFKDFNGDGYPDYIEKEGTNLKVFYSRIKRTNMLKKVTNPIKGNFVIDYAPQKVDFNNPNAKWAMTSLVINDGYDKVNDGRDTYRKDFVYTNGKYDRREREFYGYEEIKVKEYKTDILNVPTTIYRTSVLKYHNNSYFLNGLLKESYVMQGEDENKKFSRTINSYEVRELAENNTELTSTVLPNTFDVGGTEGRRTAGVILASTINELYELETSPQITSKEEMTYDAKGNVTKYMNFGDLNNNDDDYSTSIEYHHDVALNANNLVRIPKLIKLQSNTGTYRERETTVDVAVGTISSIKAKIDNSTYATSFMKYDSYGNLTYIEYPANDNGESMFYKYTYDTTHHKYLVTIKDAFNYTSNATYNDSFDKPLVTTDLSGNKMIYKYDSFGRTQTITAPKEIANGVPYTIKFQYFTKLTDIPSGSGVSASNFVPVALTQHYDAQHPTNDIETYTFIDGLARPIQVKKDIYINKTEDPDNPIYIEALSFSGKAKNDEFGRSVQQFHPYFEVKQTNTKFVLNEYSSPISSNTDYDELDRPTKVTDPAGHLTVMEYSIEPDVDGTMAIKTKTTVDQNGNETIETETYKDISGKVISTMNMGDTAIWTRFNYNNIGELTSYVDDEGLTTKYTYDNLGRKIEVNHPDNGSTQFKYDNANNLVQLTTANLAATSEYVLYTYEFNRLKSIKYPNNPDGSPNISNVKYNYGPATLTAPNNNDRGKLIEQTDASGMQIFKYGNMGEMTINERTVVSPSLSTPIRVFKTEFQYDSWNRLQVMVYPDGEKVKFDYDLGGNLTRMTGTVNNHSYNYIDHIDYDYYEQRTFLLYGNKTKTYYSYSPDLRRLDNLAVKTADNNYLYNNKYDYDFVGNVLALQNNAAPSSNGMGGNYVHGFEYDKLNRLTKADGIFTGDIAQAVVGNDYYSDYSLSMQYNTTHGIAVKTQNHFKNSTTFTPNTYDNSYTYAGGTHRLEKVSDNNTGTTEEFAYDDNGNLTKKTSSTGTTRNLYWDESNRLRVINDNDTSLQHYIYDAGGERVFKANSDITATYQNGTILDPASVTMNQYTTYPSAYIVIDGHGVYSKHYFAGSQRIVSRIGEQSVSIFDATTDSMPKQGASNEDSFDPKKLQQIQLSDLNAILEKAKLGKAKFKEYQVFTYEKAEEITKEDVDEAEQRAPGLPIDQEPLYIPMYFYHPDHLGTSTSLTDANGKAYQFFLNLPFGETMAEQKGTMYYQSPYKFNGKELDEETGLYYYGARYYDPRISNWLSVDPKAAKFPSYSPYAFCFNNPIILTDPDGQEPIPFWRRWAGAPRKAWQWYSTGVSDRLSSWDTKTFNSAALYSTQHQRASAYQTVYQRNAYYSWVQEQSDAKGYGSKWFGAAELVTRANGVGGVDLMNLGFMHDNTESFLRGGNKFLFSHNMKNAKDLLADGKLSGGFTDANGNKQSFEGLTGIALDNKLVEFEQSKVQEYINNYKGNDLGEIMTEINELMSSSLGPGAVKDVMKESFNGGKSFNFKNYADRVKLGQELIKKAHNE